VANFRNLSFHAAPPTVLTFYRTIFLANHSPHVLLPSPLRKVLSGRFLKRTKLGSITTDGLVPNSFARLRPPLRLSSKPEAPHTVQNSFREPVSHTTQPGGNPGFNFKLCPHREPSRFVFSACNDGFSWLRPDIDPIRKSVLSEAQPPFLCPSTALGFDQVINFASQQRQIDQCVVGSYILPPQSL